MNYEDIVWMFLLFYFFQNTFKHVHTTGDHIHVPGKSQKHTQNGTIEK